MAGNVYGCLTVSYETGAATGGESQLRVTGHNTIRKAKIGCLPAAFGFNKTLFICNASRMATRPQTIPLYFI